MNPEVSKILELVADQPETERAALLERYCVDPALRAEVESLLEYDTGADLFFEEAIRGVAKTIRPPDEPSPGDEVGAYRIVSQLGRGGMGSVYLAERADGEIQQRVAIKLLRAEWLRDVWRERFLRERQLLASLQHPAIVHVIDAGHTEAGRPYLAMEYVQGLPIDTYTSGMAVRRILRLFVKVCDGVAHAHRRLIIHRDLKPSNILVDASGQPKLLDFGIGKLLDDTADLTQTVERLLTPTYASPEQMRGEPQTTATDVYSVGAVLYHLVTGAPPKAPFVPPSRRNPDVPRDLDFIAAKALRPEPEDRYASVDDFAADLQAMLEWRPVEARSGNAWYRARRTVRRHWAAAAAGVLAVGSLAAGLWIANKERAIAERHFIEVRQLAGKLFDIDAMVAQLPGASRTRQLIVKTSLEYLKRVSAEGRMDPGMALDIGTAYMRVARAQGVNISANLGQTDEAEASEVKAQQLIDSVLAVRPTDRTALLRAAQIAHDRMILAGDRHHDEDSVRFASTSAALIDRYLKAGYPLGPSNHVDAQQAIIAMNNIGARYIKAGRYDEAVQICRRSIDLAYSTEWPSQAGATMITLAQAFRAQGDLDHALEAARESVRLLTPKPGETAAGRVITYSLALSREAQILGEEDSISLDRPAEAIDALEQSLKIALDFARHDDTNFQSQNRVYTAETRLAAMVRRQDPKRAVQLYDDALQRLKPLQSHAGTPAHELETLAASTAPLLQLHRLDEARRRLDLAFAKMKGAGLYPNQKVEPGTAVSRVLNAQARYETASGSLDRAAQVYSELLAGAAAVDTRTYLSDAVELSNLYRDAAPVLHQSGKSDQAASCRAKRLELWRAWSVKLPHSGFVERQLQAALSATRT